MAALHSDGQTISTSIVDRGSGGTANYTTQAIVAGNPAIAYHAFQEGNLMFARNSQPDGSGTWTISTVDSTENVGKYASLAVVAGNPAIVYQDATAQSVRFARNSQPDGSGAWTVSTVDNVATDAIIAGDVGYNPLVVLGNGRPAVAYYDVINKILKFAVNTAVDGSGTWTTSTVDNAGDVGQYASLGVIASNPAITYYDNTNTHLKFARNSAADGSGTWTIVTIDAGTNSGFYSSLNVVNGKPAVSYWRAGGVGVEFAINSAADGSGTWTITTVDATGFGETSLRILSDAHPGIVYRDNTNHIKMARNSAIDGSGTWTLGTVDATSAYSSLLVLPSGIPAVAYTSTRVKFARNSAADGSGSWTITTVENGADNGQTGFNSSHTIISGRPALSYYDATGQRVMFAINSAADGSGAWSTGPVATSITATTFSSLASVNGAPAVAYGTNNGIFFVRNSAADGSGAWTPMQVGTPPSGTTSFRSAALAVMPDGNPSIVFECSGILGLSGPFAVVGHLHAPNADGSGTWLGNTIESNSSIGSTAWLGVAGGKPAAFYFRNGTGVRFARNGADDGLGTWLLTTPDAAGTLPFGLATVHGNPAILYGSKYARNTAADGSGTWVITVVPGIGGTANSITSVAGYPVIASYTSANGRLLLARSTDIDGVNWTSFIVDSPTFSGDNRGVTNSLVMLPNWKFAIGYFVQGKSNLGWASISLPAEIDVQLPGGAALASGGTVDFGTSVIGDNPTQTFTIRNFGNADLTGLTVTKDGANAADFTVTVLPVAPVPGPNGSTTLSVQVTAATSGAKTAAIHIASNDPDENPYDINFTVHTLSQFDDTDGDGLNDAAEFRMVALGFDWQVSQPALVSALYNNANTANLFTTTQVQALNMNVPLIQKGPANGQFKLTLGIQKSTNLLSFGPFPFIPGQTVINGNGDLEFTFSVPDNAAFFRLEAH